MRRRTNASLWVALLVILIGSVSSSLASASGLPDSPADPAVPHVVEESLEELHPGDGELPGVESEEEREKIPPYFYYYLPDKPITEIPLLNKDKDNRWVNHEFLRQVDPSKHRIVEFYANWCPHCRHIRPGFIEFARRLKDVSTHYNVNLEVIAVNCVYYKVVCHHFDVHAFPRIFLLKAGTNETERIRIYHEELHPYQMLRKIGIELDADLEDEEEPLVDAALAADSSQGGPGENFWLPRRQKDIYNDAYLSFQFALKNGIFPGPGPLSNHTRDDFVDFLDILRATMPPSFKLQRLVSDIMDNIPEVLESEEALVAIVDKYPPKKTTWSHSCTRGDSSMGYTCGLWELFHIMTVGLVEYNHMVPTNDDSPFYRTGDVALTLRNFIDHFFGCEVCKLHFIGSFDSCAFSGCRRLVHHVGEMRDWIQLPMWLFEFHNGVNVRLMKEKAEREGRVPTPADEIAVQWPPRKDCPMCWNDDGRFEGKNVFAFLRLTYWPEDVYTEQLRKDLVTSPLHLRRLREAFFYKLKLVFLPMLLVFGVGGTFLYSKYKNGHDLAENKKAE